NALERAHSRSKCRADDQDADASAEHAAVQLVQNAPSKIAAAAGTGLSTGGWRGGGVLRRVPRCRSRAARRLADGESSRRKQDRRRLHRPEARAGGVQWAAKQRARI